MKLIEGLPAGDGELPVRLASPFQPGPPGPWGRRAAEALQRRLLQGAARWEALWRPGGGKMFGVLVVEAPGERLGFLSAFSGMLGGAWNVEGFVPPLFDSVARDAFWPAGEAELAALEARHAALLRDADALRAQGTPAVPVLREVEARRAEVEDLRAERSRALWRQVTQDVIPNARGKHRHWRRSSRHGLRRAGQGIARHPSSWRMPFARA